MTQADTEPSERYRAFWEALDRATRWTEDYSGRRTHDTRFGRYRALHERLISGSIIAKEEMATAVESLVDCQELVAMHVGLGDHPDREHVAARIRRMLDGPEHEKDEDADTGTSGARDAQFEMMLGAQLSLGGLDVRFPGDADLVVVADSVQGRIECKRPRSDRGLRRCINEAAAQLEAAKVEGATFVGLIALSVGVLARPASHLVVAPTESEISREYRARLDGLVRRCGRRWRGRGFAAVNGILVSHSGMSHATAENRWLRAEEVNLEIFEDVATAATWTFSEALLASLARAAAREWF